MQVCNLKLIRLARREQPLRDAQVGSQHYLYGIRRWSDWGHDWVCSCILPAWCALHSNPHHSHVPGKHHGNTGPLLPSQAAHENSVQVDSSVGGKTGVNHPLGKNMIGAFYQPKCVLIDTDTLNSLPDRELASGISGELLARIDKKWARRTSLARLTKNMS